MQIDLRLTTLERFDEVLSLPATTISIGHEGCPHKLPPLDAFRRAADAIRRSGKQAAVVVPISYERFMPAVTQYIGALVDDGPLTVVANDIGMLVVLSEHGWSTRCTVAAGHGLSYSFEQQPWIELTLEREDPAVGGAWRANSLASDAIWPQLRAWNVTQIEVDDLPRAQASYETLQQAGFALNMLVDITPVAYARSCHTARYYKATPPACTTLCDEPFELSATHRWRLYHNNLETIARKNRAHIPDMTVYGNVVYRHLATEWTQLPPAVSSLTLDVRFYSPDELITRVKHFLA